MSGPPVAGGAILVGDDGRILELGPDRAVPAPDGIERADWRAAAILPGLINLHTHLELTGFEGRVEEDEFPRWIRALRELKATRSAADYAGAARQGIRDCFAAGVTTVADTGDSGAVLPALAELGGSGVVYQEVFGPDPARADESIAALSQRLADLTPRATARVMVGVSPHAPYTVSGPLYRKTAALARSRGLPLAVHLAESPAETSFVRDGTGPFAEAWRARGLPPLEDYVDPASDPSARRSPVAWLDHHGVLGPDTLCIHTVQLDGADLDLLAARGAAVAHCPLSNARHGHGAAPLAELLRRGVRVGVGTDSVVSVGRLDLWAELRAARALAGLDARAALALATTEAARALGLERRIGRLEPGCFADFAVLAVPSAGSPDLYRTVLEAGSSALAATYVGGRRVHGRAPTA
jgi:5-methylthioadenosine/S-adenosylhomocysteine deaminase